MAREEGLFEFSATERGRSYLLAGAKRFLFWYRDSAVVSEASGEESALRLFNLANSCEVFAMQIVRWGARAAGES